MVVLVLDQEQNRFCLMFLLVCMFFFVLFGHFRLHICFVFLDMFVCMSIWMCFNLDVVAQMFLFR